jgi:hypothetical protein
MTAAGQNHSALQERVLEWTPVPGSVADPLNRPPSEDEVERMKSISQTKCPEQLLQDILGREKMIGTRANDPEERGNVQRKIASERQKEERLSES